MTDVGRPFFVRELVRGIKITDYCDQANLSTKERLDLFIQEDCAPTLDRFNRNARYAPATTSYVPQNPGQ
jgi:hypothetical protein